jgi:glycerophosphoryl diester phosphodiesterase
MPLLPPAFLTVPLAHRGLHDRAAGIVENSRAAAAAAIAAGYGIECDLQLAADGEAMVFHDDALDRLTPEAGPVRARSAAELGRVPLRDAAEGIPSFGELLALVAGRVPLLVEIKDQDGALGPSVGALEARAAELLLAYEGPVALMSFNPHSVAACRDNAPLVPRGLTTCLFRAEDWPGTDAARRAELDAIADFDRVQASFVSHYFRALGMPAVTALRAHGVPILCWTIRSPEEEAEARFVAANITFEGYRPGL